MIRGVEHREFYSQLARSCHRKFMSAMKSCKRNGSDRQWPFL